MLFRMIYIIQETCEHFESECKATCMAHGVRDWEEFLCMVKKKTAYHYLCSLRSSCSEKNRTITLTTIELFVGGIQSHTTPKKSALLGSGDWRDNRPQDLDRPRTRSKKSQNNRHNADITWEPRDFRKSTSPLCCSLSKTSVDMKYTDQSGSSLDTLGGRSCFPRFRLCQICSE